MMSSNLTHSREPASVHAAAVTIKQESLLWAPNQERGVWGEGHGRGGQGSHPQAPSRASLLHKLRVYTGVISYFTIIKKCM